MTAAQSAEAKRRLLAELLAKKQRAGEQVLATSHQQRALWFVGQQNPESAAYHVPFAVHIRAEVDEAALRRVFEAIVARHPSLRTTFSAGANGVPVQTVHTEGAPRFRRIDAVAWSKEELDLELVRAYREPFDLQKGPLLRAELFARGRTDYVLLVTIHHLVYDGWSSWILQREIRDLYAAFARNEAAPPVLSTSTYGELVARQSAMLRSPEGEAQLEYWKNKLRGTLPVLSLPQDKPRPAWSSGRCHTAAIELDRETTAALKALGQNEGATPYMIVLAAYQALLGRLSREDDILVGSPVAGRTRPEQRGVIGYFANAVVLRAELGAAETFREHLRNVKRDVLDTLAHQDFPFSALVEKLQPERRGSSSPIFQASLVFQQSDEALGGGRVVSFAGAEVEPFEVPIQDAPFELTLEMWEAGEKLAGVLKSSSDLFERESGVLWCRYLTAMLRAIAADPDQRLRSLPLEDRSAALEVAARVPLKNRSLAEMFEAQVARAPQAIAVCCEDRALSYAALNRAANRLAHRLRAFGVGPESLVGLYLDRTENSCVAILGVLKAGGAYVPLDPSSPDERLRDMIEDAGLALIVTDRATAPRLPACAAQAVVIEDSPDAHPEDLEDPSPLAIGSNAAYVIYTSGSTGRPKGVVVEHQNVLALFESTEPLFRFGAQDVWTLFHSYAFDFSVWELFGALLYGGRLVVVPYDVSRAPRSFAELMAREGVTILNQTPSAFRALLRDGALEDNRGAEALRFVIFGGEALTPANLRPWFEHHRHRATRLVNMYGITETTVHVTYQEITEAALGDPGSNIGRALPHLDIALLDDRGAPVPLGVPGEIHVGGAGVARGYLRRPELTAQRFVEGRYRSGDLACLRPDGTLRYLGRIDHQVKIRGHRIELQEIEAVLSRDASIAEAFVSVLDRGEDDRVLVAYVAPKSGSAIDESALRAHARASLPEYMVPSIFVALDRLPMTSNGKVDRRALPKPARHRDTARALIDPRTEHERSVQRVFEQVLGTSPIGIHDNFFDLGGHSLLATQILARLREASGAALSLHQFFAGPTVAELAAAIAGASGAPALTPIPVIPRSGDLALSFPQERLWLLEQIEDRRLPLYNIPVALRLRGALDVEALKRSLALIVDRHEALRTCFIELEGRPLQQIRREELRFPEPETVRDEDELRARIGEEALRPFELSTGPLLRVRLLKRADEEHVLVLVMHHIVSDGWSLGVLMRELSIAYAAFKRAEAPVLAALPLQYADYAAWQRGADLLDSDLSYWTKQLAGAPAALELPADRPHPERPTFEGGVVRFAIDRPTTARLEELARAHDVTLYMLLLSAFAAYLSRISGQDEVVIGTPVANRSRIELEGLIGFFVNNLALRVEVGGAQDFVALLGRVKKIALDAFTHQALPFEKVVEALKPERSLNRHPLFQVMFVFDGAGVVAPALDGLSLEPLPLDNVTSKFDLTLAIEHHRDGLHAQLEYRRDLFDAPRIEKMAGHLASMWAAFSRDATSPLPTAAMLSAAERAELSAWARSESAPEAVCGHRLFEAQVARDPEAIALTAGGRKISYRELDRRAAAIAAGLRARGIARGSLVAISIPRSMEMVAAVLGVWKAGAAYVPIDPAYPEARRAFMIEDSKASWVLNEASARSFAGDAPSSFETAGDPGELAYVIYTSGSTGTPKGVMVEHRGLANIAALHRDLFGVAPGARCLQFASLSFDASVWELIGALSNGAALHLEPAETVLAADALSAVIRREAITHATLPPSALRSLPLGEHASLRAIVSAGEPCTSDLVDRFATATCKLFNAYGPTETTVCATITECKPNNGAPSIGRAVPNTGVWIADRSQQLLPAGVPGELLVCGSGLARGYLGRPELTREKFVAHPVLAGQRAYRTGDRARFRADGTLEFLGRLDHQLKLRGFRIEPGEIEAAIVSAELGLEQAVVVALGNTLGAYVVPARDRSLDVPALRSALAEKLPAHLIPGRFRAIDVLPLTPNGKVDHRRLPAFDAARDPAQLVPARDDVEATLLDIWSKVLRKEKLGVHDNFFELGGDSILGMQIVARAAQQGLRLQPRQLFQHQTVAQLAVVAGRGTAIAAEQGLVRGEVPLTPIQHWYFDQDRAGVHHFNQSVFLELAAPLDPMLLKEALARVEAQHDALRLRFVRGAEGWKQAHAEGASIPLELAGLEREEEAVAEKLHAGLDLERGPVMRAALFTTPNACRLLLVAHHLVVDHVSWQVVIEDLFTAYNHLSSGTAVQLAPKTTSFQQWSERLAAHAASANIAAELDAWLAESANHPPLPVDHPQASDTVGEAATHTRELDLETTQRLLAEAPATLNARMHELVLTAVATGVAAWSGRQTLRIDVETHGRETFAEDLDITRTVGWFTALHPVELKVEREPLASLTWVKEALRRAPLGGLGYGLLRYLRPDPSIRERLARAAAPQISFNFLGQVGIIAPNAIVKRMVPGGLGSPHAPAARRPHRLEVNAAIVDGRLQLAWTYGQNVYHRSSIEKIAAEAMSAFERMLSAKTAPQPTAADFPAARLSKADLGRVLAKVQKTRTRAP